MDKKRFKKVALAKEEVQNKDRPKKADRQKLRMANMYGKKKEG